MTCGDGRNISIHALLAESDLHPKYPKGYRWQFLSTLSLRRATDVNNPVFAVTSISIHALLAESDGFSYFYIIKITDFYPRSPCGERQGFFVLFYIFFLISIHALLAESDKLRHPSRPGKINFYPRSPCGERQLYINRTAKAIIFLSTLSLRRATHYDNYNLHCVEISIHALLAESDRCQASDMSVKRISIHALLAESDKRAEHHANNQQEFLSTLSLRRATICALWMALSLLLFLSTLSLRRATLTIMLYDTSSLIFLSTLSLRRATRYLINTYHRIFGISIHALLAESDFTFLLPLVLTLLFLSTLSLRRATTTIIIICIALRFLSTLSLRRATLPCVTSSNGKVYFYPRSPCGERPETA